MNMKKTLIVFSAFGSAVFAENAPSAISFSYLDDVDVPGVIDSQAAGYVAPSGRYLSLSDMLLTSGTGSVPTIPLSQKIPGFLSPDVNVGNGGSWSFTFTLTNNYTESVTLNSIDLGVVMFTMSGSAQTASVSRSATFTLSWDGSGSVSTSDVLRGNGSYSSVNVDGTSTKPSLDLSGSALTLEAGASKTFTLTASRFDSGNSEQMQGCFYGLRELGFDISSTCVPEPTTATLSLLALAGLASRRRRK